VASLELDSQCDWNARAGSLTHSKQIEKAEKGIRALKEIEKTKCQETEYEAVIATK